MNKFLISAVVLVLFVGCSIKDVSRPIVKYDLGSAQPAVQSDLSTDRVLKVSKFKTPLKLLGDKIWYKRGDLETNSYLYSAWSGDFSGMVENRVTNILYKSGLFRSVFNSYSKARADFVLEGEIVRAVEQVYEKKAYVLFEVRLYLVDSKSSSLVASKDFSYRQECESADASGAIKAYSRVFKIFEKEVVLWLKRLVKEGSIDS